MRLEADISSYLPDIEVLRTMPLLQIFPREREMITLGMQNASSAILSFTGTLFLSKKHPTMTFANSSYTWFSRNAQQGQ